jgi:autotransporter-associated beta strand protein
VSDVIADSTGSGGGTIGVTKLGTNTLVLSNANTYTGVTTVSGGTLELAHNSAAGTSAGGIAVSGALAATLQINAGITTGDDIVFSNTNAASNVKRDIAASGTYTTGTSGTLSSDLVGGKPNTTASILTALDTSNSVASSATTLTMSFSGTSGALNDGARRSDVFTISGLVGSDSIVLQLFAGSLGSDSRLGWLDGSNLWANVGSNAFGAWDNSLTYALGDYGYDSGTGAVWAVVDGSFTGGSFTVIPEPSTALGGLLLTAGLLRRRRRHVEA